MAENIQNEVKKRKVAKAIVEGKTVKDSLLAAGYSESTATKSSGRVMPEVRRHIVELFDEHGLSDEEIAKKMKELSEAKQTIFATRQGVITHKEEVPDPKVQTRAMELVTLIKGHQPRKELESAPGAQVLYTFSFAGAAPSQLPASPGLSVSLPPQNTAGDTPPDVA